MNYFFNNFSPKFEKSILEIFDFEKSVEQYNVEGGTAKSSVIYQINQLQQKTSVMNWAFHL